MPVGVTIKTRRGTAAEWSAANPTLAAGEPGYETDTGILKIGDGVTAYNTLPARVPTSQKTTRSATIVIAASNSSAKSKAQADYVCDGINDEVEIQAAIYSLSATGGRILLLEGTYNVTNVLCDVDDITLEGEGRSTVLKLNNAANSSIISIGKAGESHSNITIKNVTLDGNSNEQTSEANKSALLSIPYTVSNITVESVYFTNAYACAIKTASSVASNVSIIQCDFYDTDKSARGNHVVDLNGITQLVIDKCYIDLSGSGTTISDGFGIRGCTDVNISNVSISNISGHCIMIANGSKFVNIDNVNTWGSRLEGVCVEWQANGTHGLDGIYNQDININNVIVNQTSMYGIYVEDVIGVNVSNCIVNGPVLLNHYYANNCMDVNYVNCIARVGVNAQYMFFSLGNATNVSYENCIAHPSTAGARGFGCLAGAKNIIFNNCYVYDCDSYAISMAADGTIVKNCTLSEIKTTAYPVGITGANCQFIGNTIQYATGITPAQDIVITRANATVIDNKLGKGNITDSTGTAVFRRFVETFTDVKASVTNSICSSVDLSTAVPISFTLAGQPDYARSIKFAFASHANITAFSITITGINSLGAKVSETFTESDGWSFETRWAYSRILSITMTSRTGSGASDTINVGTGDRLGLSNLVFPGMTIYKALKNGVDYTGYSISAVPYSYVSVAAGGAIVDGDDFIFYYNSGNTV